LAWYDYLLGKQVDWELNPSLKPSALPSVLLAAPRAARRSSNKIDESELRDFIKFSLEDVIDFQ
jgi:hypothetical protein